MTAPVPGEHPDPPPVLVEALALIDDLLRPWISGHPVYPGRPAVAAPYEDQETVQEWNDRRAALASTRTSQPAPAFCDCGHDRQEHEWCDDGRGKCETDRCGCAVYAERGW